MGVWVAVWYRAFRRDLEVRGMTALAAARRARASGWSTAASTRSPGSCCSVMLAPIVWLVASSLQTDGQLSTGSYDLLHPTFTAFTPDVADASTSSATSSTR